MSKQFNQNWYPQGYSYEQIQKMIHETNLIDTNRHLEKKNLIRKTISSNRAAFLGNYFSLMNREISIWQSMGCKLLSGPAIYSKKENDFGVYCINYREIISKFGSLKPAKILHLHDDNINEV